MTNDKQSILRQLADNPASVPFESLRSLLDDMPYSPLPAMALLKYHSDKLDDSHVDALRLHLAVISGDKKALFDQMSVHSADFEGIYPPSQPVQQPSTESAIDTFFANYGTSDSKETALLERMIFNPTPDYAETLLREEDAGQGDDVWDDPRIQTFIDRHPPVETVATPAASVKPEVDEKPSEQPQQKNQDNAHKATADNSLLSESLAKIFIKQGRYERAYEIISNLSLNYPKKSIYFADQLRFLQKLIKIKQATGNKIV